MSNPFIGQVIMFGGNFAPINWAFCDGSLQSIAQNTALFSLLGTTYGGNGQTTFALPDLRGRVPIGMGQGPGLSPYTIGETGGVENVTLTTNQLPAHTHTAACTTDIGDTTNPAGNFWAAQPALGSYTAPPGGSAMDSGSVNTAGSSQPHNNIIPYQSINYVIALFGVFPSRN